MNYQIYKYVQIAHATDMPIPIKKIKECIEAVVEEVSIEFYVSIHKKKSREFSMNTMKESRKEIWRGILNFLNSEETSKKLSEVFS